MFELIKGEFEEVEAQAIAAALAKICGVKKISQLALVDDEDIAAVAVEAKLPKVGIKMLSQIIASKATPKAASATPAAPIVTPPPPPPDHRLDLLPSKVHFLNTISSVFDILNHIRYIFMILS